MKRTIFSVLIGNCDAHAKNFSLLHRTRDAIELAPVYDLVSTRYYPEFSERIDKLYAFQWKRFCEEVGIGFPARRKALFEIHEALKAAISSERPPFAEPNSGRILDFIETHAAAVAQRLERPD